jgi:hypothetical protein
MVTDSQHKPTAAFFRYPSTLTNEAVVSSERLLPSTTVHDPSVQKIVILAHVGCSENLQVSCGQQLRFKAMFVHILTDTRLWFIYQKMLKLGEGAIGRGPEKTALNEGDQIKESEMDGECGT